MQFIGERKVFLRGAHMIVIVVCNIAQRYESKYGTDIKTNAYFFWFSSVCVSIILSIPFIECHGKEKKIENPPSLRIGHDHAGILSFFTFMLWYEES